MAGNGQFWKPGQAAPGIGLGAERAGESSDADVVPHNPNSGMSLQQQRARLPIFKHREHILFLLEKYTTVVIVGETGCGKTTQVPQYLHEAGWTSEGRVVACLQPRRVAAITVAQRVAEERRCRLGAEVGYSIRFDECANSALTRIKYMTEGMIVREMMRDPLLNNYSVIMLDEAHERTLFLDIVVGLLYKIQKRRPELRVIVSSATLDAQTFRKFFNHNHTRDPTKDTSAILSVEGRAYPVDILYAEAAFPDYVEGTIQTIIEIHLNEEPGDILAFLTGQDEVDSVVEKVKDRLERMPKGRFGLDFIVLPMYGGLPSNDQLKVFDRAPEGNRKIVVATNVAEASVTIHGIVYVVDSGFVKMKGYSAKTGIESLVVTPVSKASATQRAGRAGRLRPGKAFRLYTEVSYDGLLDSNVPEMQRSNLSGVLLQLKALGVDNILRFPFLSPPPASNMVRALEILYALGAIDDQGKLTEPLGIQLAEFPLDPQQGKMILSSGQFNCSEEILSIAAMLQVQHVFLAPPKNRKQAERERIRFSCEEGDHLSLLNVYNCFIQSSCSSRWCGQHCLNYKSLKRAVEIRGQLMKYIRKFRVPLRSADGDVDTILRCIVSGFFANAARLDIDGSYRTVRGKHMLAVHPSSVLYTEKHPSYVVFNEVLLTSQNYMRDITAIDPEWLSELAPHFYQFNAQLGRGDRDIDELQEEEERA